MDERMERLGRNESLFRSVNERVKGVNEAFSVVLEYSDFVCECSARDCLETVSLTLDEYERVRADATQFVLRPGHELEDVERVVERNDRYAIVRKHDGRARHVAQELDPRS